MSNRAIISSTIGGLALSAAVYLTNAGDVSSEENSVQLSAVSQIRSENMPSPMSDMVVSEASGNAMVVLDVKHEPGGIAAYLERNPSLKIRIQGTSWYRDYCAGLIDGNTVLEHLEYARRIEIVLELQTGLIDRIQHEGWWGKYLSGEITPRETSEGSLDAFLRIDEFRREWPEAYERIQTHPRWNRDYSDDMNKMLVRVELVDELVTKARYIDSHPEVVERLEKFWFSKQALFTSEFLSDRPVMSRLEIIFLLEDPSQFPAEAYDAFWKSEIGLGYKNGEVDPLSALAHMISTTGRLTNHFF